jgi:hypothetical protein
VADHRAADDAGPDRPIHEVVGRGRRLARDRRQRLDGHEDLSAAVPPEVREEHDAARRQPTELRAQNVEPQSLPHDDPHAVAHGTEAAERVGHGDGVEVGGARDHVDPLEVGLQPARHGQRPSERGGDQPAGHVRRQRGHLHALRLHQTEDDGHARQPTAEVPGRELQRHRTGGDDDVDAEPGVLLAEIAGEPRRLPRIGEAVQVQELRVDLDRRQLAADGGVQPLDEGRGRRRVGGQPVEQQDARRARGRRLLRRNGCCGRGERPRAGEHEEGGAEDPPRGRSPDRVSHQKSYRTASWSW